MVADSEGGPGAPLTLLIEWHDGRTNRLQQPHASPGPLRQNKGRQDTWPSIRREKRRSRATRNAKDGDKTASAE